MKKFGTFSSAILLASSAVFLGCDSSDVAVDDAVPATQVSYLVDAEPAGAVGVGEARENAKDEETVVLVGRIGGSAAPFVDGMAAFTIVDPKVPHCSDDEGCPTPWDYCCTQDLVKDNVATVKLVDADGAPLNQDARKLLGVKELSEVVVEGKADRDDAGNLVVVAEKVYVKK